MAEDPNKKKDDDLESIVTGGLQDMKKFFATKSKENRKKRISGWYETILDFGWHRIIWYAFLLVIVLLFTQALFHRITLETVGFVALAIALMYYFYTSMGKK